MNCNILKTVMESFSALWKCEVLDDITLKIQVPYISINNRIIQLYIKSEKDSFIVSDGGYLEDIFHSGEFCKINKKVFSRIFEIYKEEHSISQTVNEKFYYKKASNKEMLANVVFDMSDFCKMYIDALSISSVEPKPNDDIVLAFEKEAKTFLKKKYSEKNSNYELNCNATLKLVKDKDPYKFNVAISTKKGISAIQFLSGADNYHYTNKVAKIGFDYKILKNYPMINLTLSIYDDECKTYKENQNEINNYLDFLGSIQGNKPVPKSKIENICDLVNNHHHKKSPFPQ